MLKGTTIFRNNYIDIAHYIEIAPTLNKIDAILVSLCIGMHILMHTYRYQNVGRSSPRLLLSSLLVLNVKVLDSYFLAGK